MKCFEFAKLLTNLFRGQWGRPGGGGGPTVVEQSITNLGIEGSNPAVGTKIKNKNYSKSLADYRDQFYKRIFVRNLRIFVIR